MFETIDTSGNKVLIVKDGKVTEIEVPFSGFGEQTIVWKDKKVVGYTVSGKKNL